jgi:hypothetical protein
MATDMHRVSDGDEPRSFITIAMANDESRTSIAAMNDETEAWMRFLDVAQKLAKATAELVLKES